MIHLFNVQTGDCVLSLDGHQSRIKALDIASINNGVDKVLVSASSDGAIKCWKLPSILDSASVKSLKCAGTYNAGCRLTCLTAVASFKSQRTTSSSQGRDPSNGHANIDESHMSE